jgi:hypothetical protein
MSQSTCDVLLFFTAVFGGLGALLLILFGIPTLILHLTRHSHRKHMDVLEEDQRMRIAQFKRWREDAKPLKDPYDVFE